MLLVTPRTYDRLAEWYDRALMHVEVSRFLAVDKLIQPPAADAFASDWNRVGFLSDSGQTYAAATIDRDGAAEISISLWSLAGGMQRKIECGRMILFLKQYLLRSYRPRALRCMVHASNEPSLKLMNKIFGSPWGIEPLAGWDGGLGEFVDIHHFRVMT